jgi:peptide/nickel transport system permease protein
MSSTRRRTLWGDAWYRLRRNKLAVFALVWLAIVTVIAALTADLWVPAAFGDPRIINTTDSSGAAAA